MSRRSLLPNGGDATDEVVRQVWVRLCRHLRDRGAFASSSALSPGELIGDDVSDGGREAASVEIVLEAWDVVTRALALLTDREIAVFVRRLEGATEVAIAEALNISTGQVDSDLKRVVAVLARPESV